MKAGGDSNGFKMERDGHTDAKSKARRSIGFSFRFADTVFKCMGIFG